MISSVRRGRRGARFAAAISSRPVLRRSGGELKIAVAQELFRPKWELLPPACQRGCGVGWKVRR
jgi:hypothetical protein